MDHYDESYRKVLRDLPQKVPLQRFGTEAEVGSAEERLDAGEIERPELLLLDADRQLTVDILL